MLVRLGTFLFRWRNALFPLAMALVFLPGLRLFDDPMYAALLGFVIAMAGQSVRVLTIGLEYVIRGGRDRRVYAEALVTGGLYQLSRNPMYVGNLVILVGLAVASNSWLCVAVAVGAFALAYRAIVAAEEGFLRAKFGSAYERYVAEVPRWLPRPRDLLRLAVGSRFHWRRVLVKEYGTPMGWIAMMLIVLLLQLHRARMLDAHATELSIILAFFATLFVAYLTVRRLKRSRRISAD